MSTKEYQLRVLAVVWLIGVYAILYGIMYVVVYFESRSLAASVA